MADRRGDDAPLAPRRSLSGPATTEEDSGTSAAGNGSDSSASKAPKVTPARRPRREPSSGSSASGSSGTSAGGSSRTRASNGTSTSSGTSTGTGSGTGSGTSTRSPQQRATESDRASGTDEKPPVKDRVNSAVAAAGGAVAAAGGAVAAAAKSAGPATRPSTRKEPVAKPAKPGSGRTRRARLRLVHLDPWSVMKTSFLLSIAFGIVTVVAVAVILAFLAASGLYDSINTTVGQVLGGSTAQTFNIENYIGTSRILGATMVLAALDVVLITALATLGAFLYNLSAALLGGVEVTLAEDDR